MVNDVLVMVNEWLLLPARGTQEFLKGGVQKFVYIPSGQ